MKVFKATASAIGKRADVFVASKYSQFTRSALKGLFEAKKVFINSQVAKPGERLRSGDKITVESESLSVQPPAINLPILYEDKNVIVIDKPPGVLTHSKGAFNLEATVASFIRPKLTDKSLRGNRAGIVHRLDRATSGVIICARNQEALNWLQQQFSARQVKKTYLAIVEGKLHPKAAIIDVPIGRNPRRPQTFKATTAGKPARTDYKVLEYLKKTNKLFSLVELRPLSGRTHQIRLHLAYIGYPVVGDSIYGHNGEQLMLHAHELEIGLPDGRQKRFVSAMPTRFKEFINQ